MSEEAVINISGARRAANNWACLHTQVAPRPSGPPRRRCRPLVKCPKMSGRVSRIRCRLLHMPRPRQKEHGRAAFNNDAGCAPRHTHTVSIGKSCISDLISQSLSNPYSEGINLDIAQSTYTSPSIHPPRHNVSKQAQASSDHIPSEKPQAPKSSYLGIVILPQPARRRPHAHESHAAQWGRPRVTRVHPYSGKVFSPRTGQKCHPSA